MGSMLQHVSGLYIMPSTPKTDPKKTHFRLGVEGVDFLSGSWSRRKRCSDVTKVRTP